MLRRTVIFLIVVEIAFFIIAALRHAGLSVFGYTESRVISESLTQGAIGLVLALCAYGIWRRRHWSRKLAIAIHVLGIAGALFGMLAVREAENSLNAYNVVRLVILVVVFILLLTPKMKITLKP